MQNWEQRKILPVLQSSEALLAVPLPHVADVSTRMFPDSPFQTHPADKLFQRNLIQAFQCSFKNLLRNTFQIIDRSYRAIKATLSQMGKSISCNTIDAAHTPIDQAIRRIS